MSRSKTIVVDKEENSAVSFVSRWSRLKHETKHNSENTATVDTVVEESELDDKELDDKSEAPVKVLTDEDMPDIELMTDDSDYTGFLSPGVSEALRKLALRKLFHSEVFNIRDGLDEYDGDYTQFEKLGGIVTSDMQHQIEMEAKRKAKELLQKEEKLPDDNDFNEEDINDIDNDNENNLLLDSDIDNSQSDEPETLQSIQAVEEKLIRNSLQSDRADDKGSIEGSDDTVEVEKNI